MFSIISLTSSTPVLLAASNSITSILFSLSIEVQFSQLSQGSISLSFEIFRQFTILEIILAIVVFPTPLVPENK